MRAIRKVGWWKWPKGSLRRAIFRACTVANENYHHFRVVLVRTDPATERLILTAAQLDALKCHAGSRSSGAPVRRGENSMTLWINGDWVTGGAHCV